MKPIVHLHVGEPKTGTTFVQAMLFHNQDALLANQVLIPGTKLDQIRGGHDILGRSKTAGTHDTEGAWESLSEAVSSFDGEHAIVSMEMLTRARGGQIRRAVSAFGAHADVRVIITARDVADLVPARWQESVQFRRSWTFDDYLAGVFAAEARETPSGRHFWDLHDTPSTVRGWSEAVGLEHVTVVTVPKARIPPDLLWRRFGEAVGIAVEGYAPVARANASLGQASAELMRRLNAALENADLREADYARICRQGLAKSTLPSRRGLEAAISLPSRYRATAHARSVDLVEGLRATGVPVVGDLDDLIGPEGPGEDDEPTVSQPSSEAVADAAVEALVALVAQNAALRREGRVKRRNAG